MSTDKKVVSFPPRALLEGVSEDRETRMRRVADGSAGVEIYDLALEIEGEFAGFVKATSDASPGWLFARAGQAQPMFDPTSEMLDLLVPIDASMPLREWLMASWRGEAARLAGSVTMLRSLGGGASPCVEFVGATLVTATVPTLDRLRVAPDFLRVRLAPEYLRLSQAHHVGKPSRAAAPTWAPAHFRMEIPGLGSIERVEALALPEGANLVALGHAELALAGESAVPYTAHRAALPDLRLTVRESDLAPWLQWTQRARSEGAEACRNGAIVFLSASGAPLARLSLMGLLPLSVEPGKDGAGRHRVGSAAVLVSLSRLALTEP